MNTPNILSKKNQRGLSMLELMAVGGILCVLLVLGGLGIRALASGDSVENDAAEEVRLYASKLGIAIDKTPQGKDAISCGNITTKKGLVGCTYKSGGVTHQLECIGRYSPGHGCRDQKLSVPSSGAAESTQ
jgi:hypothetical protein